MELSRETVLELRQISRRFRHRSGDVQALSAVDLRVHRGESVVIQGASGSGKSTLLLVAAAMLRPTSGDVSLCGQNLSKISLRRAGRLRKQKVGIILPALELIPYLTAGENVYLLDASSPGKQRARELLENFGLSARWDHLPGQLSTGEQRRVLVARAMFNTPEILFCDEPTANLDAENAAIIRAALLKCCQEAVAVVTVTHEDAKLFAADRQYQLAGGQLEMTGS